MENKLQDVRTAPQTRSMRGSEDPSHPMDVSLPTFVTTGANPAQYDDKVPRQTLQDEPNPAQPPGDYPTPYNVSKDDGFQ